MGQDELEPGQAERVLLHAHLPRECLQQFAIVPILYETLLLTVTNKRKYLCKIFEITFTLNS